MKLLRVITVSLAIVLTSLARKVPPGHEIEYHPAGVAFTSDHNVPHCGCIKQRKARGIQQRRRIWECMCPDETWTTSSELSTTSTTTTIPATTAATTSTTITPPTITSANTTITTPAAANTTMPTSTANTATTTVASTTNTTTVNNSITTTTTPLTTTIPVSCDGDYSALVPTHTLCMVANANFTDTCNVDIQLILDTHNAYRSGVNPPAANMQKIVWDADLAAIAQAWTEQCQLGHDTGTRYLIGVSPSPGQNGAFGFSSWTAAIAGWYNEVTDFQYGIPLANYNMEFGKIGHYIQLVQDKASRIGCGCAMCKDVLADGVTLPHYFCNYLSPTFQISEPYVSGSQCDACSNTCLDGLCDCGGKYCYNFGFLDVNTCLCTCLSAFTGPLCRSAI